MEGSENKRKPSVIALCTVQIARHGGRCNIAGQDDIPSEHLAWAALQDGDKQGSSVDTSARCSAAHVHRPVLLHKPEQSRF